MASLECGFLPSFASFPQLWLRRSTSVGDSEGFRLHLSLPCKWASRTTRGGRGIGQSLGDYKSQADSHTVALLELRQVLLKAQAKGPGHL